MIAVVHIASTGFRPEGQHILEVAAALLTPDAREVVDTFSSLVAAHPDFKVPPFHAALLQECAQLGVPELRAVEGALIARNWDIKAICSRGLSWQLEWIAAKMPSFIRTLRFALPLELKALEMLSGVEHKGSFNRTYRASDDVVLSVEELQSYVVVKR